MSTHDGGMLYRCEVRSDEEGLIADDEIRPCCWGICTLADYLGIGTGQLAAYTVTDLTSGESYARIYWWQPPMLVARPFRHAGAGI